MGSNTIIAIVVGAILVIVGFALWPVLNGASNSLYSVLPRIAALPMGALGTGLRKCTWATTRPHYQVHWHQTLTTPTLVCTEARDHRYQRTG